MIREIVVILLLFQLLLLLIRSVACLCVAVGGAVQCTSARLTPGAESGPIKKAIVDDDGYFCHHQPIANSEIHHKSVCGSSQRAASEMESGPR